MKHAILAGVVVFAGSIALAGSSEAIIMTNHGTTCAPSTNSDVSKVSYSFFGVQNNSTTASAGVECGMTVATGTSAVASWSAYDRNNGSDVCCTIRMLNFVGDVTSSIQRCTTGFGSAAQTPGGLSAPAATEVAMSTFTCTIPPQTSVGTSHITRVTLKDTPSP